MAGRRIWIAAAAAMVAGCHQKEITVSQGWVRLSTNPSAPAAAYFTLNGSPLPVTLARVEIAHVARVELHESMASGPHGMTGMRPLASVPVPPRGKVEFAPGGRHAMLFGVDASVHPATTLAATFVLSDGFRAPAHLAVVGAGDPAPY